MVLSVPFHTVLGLTIMQSRTLFGGDWYPNLHLSWADPWSDQVVAGGVLWAGGEIVSVTMLGILVMQWIRQSEREARRIDRALDRAEAEQNWLRFAPRASRLVPLQAGELSWLVTPQEGERAAVASRGERGGGRSVRSARTFVKRPAEELDHLMSDQYTVMLYSDDVAVRDKIRMALGPRPAADM